MKPLLRIVSLALLLTLGGTWLRAETVEAKPAPQWTLKDTDGKDVRFADFKGKVVVIDFWATWCAPCRIEIPGYIKLQDKYRNDGLVIIGISLDRQGPKVVKKFAADQKVNYLLLMADDDVQEEFGDLSAIPTTFIIDRDGQIRERKTGVMDGVEFEQIVLKYLKPDLH